jgi:CheY-like chemotaxis protein
MPEMDGMEATLAIRKLENSIGKRVPILALTAGALKEEMDKCYEVGMDGFLTKPIEPKKLREILSKYCQSIDCTS